MRRRQVASLLRQIAEQERWIAEHGRTEAGYIERYGAAEDPRHYGDGGELIWAADAGKLEQLRQELRRKR